MIVVNCLNNLYVAVWLDLTMAYAHRYVVGGSRTQYWYIHKNATSDFYNQMHNLDSKWLRDDNIMLIGKTVRNMDTNWGKYNHDILIRLNWRTSRIYVLDMQEICSVP